MKKLLTLSLLTISASGYAAQCRVDINNEVRMDGQNLEIVHTNGEKRLSTKTIICLSKAS